MSQFNFESVLNCSLGYAGRRYLRGDVRHGNISATALARLQRMRRADEAFDRSSSIPITFRQANIPLLHLQQRRFGTAVSLRPSIPPYNYGVSNIAHKFGTHHSLKCWLGITAMSGQLSVTEGFALPP